MEKEQTKRFTVEVEGEIYRNLKIVGFKEGKTKRKLLEEALKTFLKERQQ